MGRTVQLAVACVAVLVVTVGHVKAETLTFDELVTAVTDPIPNGYGGFQWNNFAFACRDFILSQYAGTGYDNGMVSTPNIAYNENGNPAAFSSDTPFTLNGAYLTGAWNNGLQIIVDGLVNDSVVYSRTVVVDTTSPTWFDFNFQNVTKVNFTSSGGTPAHGNDFGYQIIMDNLKVNEIVPEPSALIGLLSMGIVGLGLAWWRRKRLG